MNKAISTLVAAVAALTLSGGAYAQAGGGSSGGGSAGSTASPANQNGTMQMNGQMSGQMNGATGGYGTPGITNSDSGMGAKAPNSGLPSTNSTPAATSAPKTNNTLATPSVVSPGAGQ